MTIGVATVVPDGIALAADTQTTWTRKVTTVKEKGTDKDVELAQPLSIPVGWSQGARKLFSVKVGDKTFAIITAGEARLHWKTMFAFFQSAAHAYQETNPTCADAAKHFVDGLKSELANAHGCATSDLSKQVLVAHPFILAGYDDDDVAKPVLEYHIVFSGALPISGKLDTSGHVTKSTNADASGARQCTACWIGDSAYIDHLVNHKNTALSPLSGQYELMTLADAVDYTKFLVSYTCDFQRFAVMVPTCGRPITSATLTPEGYEEQLIP